MPIPTSLSAIYYEIYKPGRDSLSQPLTDFYHFQDTATSTCNSVQTSLNRIARLEEKTQALFRLKSQEIALNEQLQLVKHAKSLLKIQLEAKVKDSEEKKFDGYKSTMQKRLVKFLQDRDNKELYLGMYETYLAAKEKLFASPDDTTLQKNYFVARDILVKQFPFISTEESSFFEAQVERQFPPTPDQAVRTKAALELLVAQVRPLAPQAAKDLLDTTERDLDRDGLLTPQVKLELLNLREDSLMIAIKAAAQNYATEDKIVTTARMTAEMRTRNDPRVIIAKLNEASSKVEVVRKLRAQDVFDEAKLSSSVQHVVDFRKVLGLLTDPMLHSHPERYPAAYAKLQKEFADWSRKFETEKAEMRLPEFVMIDQIICGKLYPDINPQQKCLLMEAAFYSYLYSDASQNLDALINNLRQVHTIAQRLDNIALADIVFLKIASKAPIVTSQLLSSLNKYSGHPVNQTALLKHLAKLGIKTITPSEMQSIVDQARLHHCLPLPLQKYARRCDLLPPLSDEKEVKGGPSRMFSSASESRVTKVEADLEKIKEFPFTYDREKMAKNVSDLGKLLESLNIKLSPAELKEFYDEYKPRLRQGFGPPTADVSHATLARTRRGF